MDTAGQVGADGGNESTGLIAVNAGAFAQFAQQIFAGLFNKAQYRPQALFAPVLGIVAFAGALLVAVNRFDGGIDVDADLVKLDAAQLPDTFAQNAHHL